MADDDSKYSSEMVFTYPLKIAPNCFESGNEPFFTSYLLGKVSDRGLNNRQATINACVFVLQNRSIDSTELFDWISQVTAVGIDIEGVQNRLDAIIVIHRNILVKFIEQGDLEEIEYVADILLPGLYDTEGVDAAVSTTNAVLGLLVSEPVGEYGPTADYLMECTLDLLSDDRSDRFFNLIFTTFNAADIPDRRRQQWFAWLGKYV
ncbi:hypothetical protein FQA18_19755 [Haloferax volcanii]|uniref:Uncharacterized protein n=2 Tax=Haloferax volcanii TaxID=2246 RepID=A0A558FK24_HALVO|nr:hypothetical protein FQA18_19755 [Haloferax volcanii]